MHFQDGLCNTEKHYMKQVARAPTNMEAINFLLLRNGFKEQE